MWIGFICLRIWSNGRPFELGFLKWLFGCEEECCSIDLVNHVSVSLEWTVCISVSCHVMTRGFSVSRFHIKGYVQRLQSKFY
jgi:hypothetical protein